MSYATGRFAADWLAEGEELKTNTLYVEARRPEYSGINSRALLQAKCASSS